MILAGTGPAGGEGISTVARVTYLDMLRGFLTRQDPKQFLFFTRTPGGIRAGKEFLARLKERSQNLDKEISVTALQAQLKALRRWGSKAPADLSKIHQPVLVANGDSDRMVPSKNTHDLARRLSKSDLIIYPDSGTRCGIPVLRGLRTEGAGIPCPLSRGLSAFVEAVWFARAELAGCSGRFPLAGDCRVTICRGQSCNHSNTSGTDFDGRVNSACEVRNLYTVSDATHGIGSVRKMYTNIGPTHR